MFNRQPFYLHTSRFQRPSQKGNVLPSVAQYLQKVRTPEKNIPKQKESPSYRIKSNPKINSQRQASSSSPSREKPQLKYNSFHSQQIKQKKRLQEMGNDSQVISRRQKTEAAVENCVQSPKKNVLQESQEIMLKLQKNAAVRRVKTEECDREDHLHSVRGTVQRQNKNQKFENQNLLDLLLLSTVELKHHFEQTRTARQIMPTKARAPRLSIRQFPKDFFC
ncbi:unnamed protein product (macronuclear) [Paramecium tetraurelia]|uniref:TPX2 C-terminal domain-containing protein n=1 Tax=Paramecium tetraurelia TaxID=5888 RepID=A0E1H7_PARTE|nr:uncharacterized protein GSPATT00022313001 [Paramecium tetraurelia]CAK89144.1 unnamed protein product [Paramecium tetraurelia]|eukprot:XP_001456541.1 hypothetical protein (macronuclear) [Paramecium tetraurelia strain d4-2]